MDNFIPPYLRSYKEFDFENHKWNFVCEAAYDNYGSFVSVDTENMDILSFIVLIKMLATELGKQLDSDD